MELQTILEKRRSIREYRTDKVEDDKIREIIRAGILAPSWKNSQVTRYYAVRSEEMLGKVRRLCRSLIRRIRRMLRCCSSLRS